MSRRRHEEGDCNGDWTCPWCWREAGEVTMARFEDGIADAFDEVEECEDIKRFEDGLVDPVAVARALQGDATVWPRLRRGERHEVYLAILARREAELDSYRDWREVYRDVTKGGGKPAEDKPDHRDWLLKIADARGVSSRRLLDAARRFTGRNGVL